MKRAAARFATYLPERWLTTLNRITFAWQLKLGQFVTGEPEFEWVGSVIRPGDTVIDVGANAGVYTRKFASLVGPTGRVVAFEPVPESFHLLTVHTSLLEYRNVTLLNLAASDKMMVAAMSIPRSSGRLRDYYRASIAGPSVPVDEDRVQVLCCPLDSLCLPAPVRLVKIDVEGHEAAVLSGMRCLIERDKPVLIIESISPEICEWLSSQGYGRTNLPGSPNTIFQCTDT
jgi:FkbM family methyltransferase